MALSTEQTTPLPNTEHEPNVANQKMALAIDFVFNKFGGDVSGPLVLMARGMMIPFRKKLLAADPTAIKLAVAVFASACARIEDEDVTLEAFNDWLTTS